ncbi:MAG: Xaa-Pro peptidase family protein [Candidatus Omnitrophota bacterium]
MSPTKHDAVLMIGASERDANLRYATRFLAPDPFVYVALRGKTYLLMNDLEFGRAKTQANVDEVLAISVLEKRLKERGKKAAFPDLVDLFFRGKRVKTILVPGYFNFAYAEALREKGYRLIAKEEPFFKERLFKTKEEIANIAETLRATEAAMEAGIQTIVRSRISNGKLYADGEALTSERVKQTIHLELLKHDCAAEHTIVACGNDAVDPHNEGAGPLRAEEPIVIDLFPRSRRHGYVADITRTVVKGKAKPKVKRMYRAVKEAQEIAFHLLKDGAEGSSVHCRILRYFDKQGFRTGHRKGKMQGFFHGTGHGVGLEVHEPPRISSVKEVIRARQVVTVEPALYYLDAGGVRIEDLVVVTKTGIQNLTRFPKQLEIP